MELEWIPTGDVQVGDRIACLLSDARDYLEVTGWTDKLLNLSRLGLDDVTHRTFKTKYTPWWAFDMKTFSLSGETLIVAREG
jgi:hypothetical protein